MHAADCKLLILLQLAKQLEMKRNSIVLVLLTGLVLMGASTCSSDPNVEGAKLDLRNQDFDRAMENVETALQRDPDNAEALDLKGQIIQEQLATVQDVEQHSQAGGVVEVALEGAGVEIGHGVSFGLSR